MLASQKMMESTLKTEASSKNSKKHFTAHVDCSNGICEKTLLAACLDAFSDDDLKYGNANEALERFHASIFGNTSDTNSMPTRVSAVKQKSSKHLCIVCARTTPSALTETSNWSSSSGILDTLKDELAFDDSKSPKVVKWEGLPDWVVTMTRCVFSEIFKATERVQQQQHKDEKNNEEDDDNNDNDNDKASNDTRRTNAKVAYLHIFYVIATLLCLDSMGVRKVSCSPLPMCTSDESSKAVDIVTELLFGMTINPVVTTNFDDDNPCSYTSVLSTTIGIALLRVLTGVYMSQRSLITPIVLQKSGRGVNDKTDIKVSIIIGFVDSHDFGISESISKRDSPLFNSDHVAHLETNLDDISGENLAFAIELLLQNGAIDAWVTPIVMKKGRPAHTLHCLCKDNESDDNNDDDKSIDSLLELIFIHTSTLGVRIYRKVPRAKLDRSISTVKTSFTNTSRKGQVDIKISKFKNGQIVRKKAEFDHCREISIEAGIGIQIVADQAIKAFDNRNNT